MDGKFCPAQILEIGFTAPSTSPAKPHQNMTLHIVQTSCSRHLKPPMCHMHMFDTLTQTDANTQFHACCLICTQINAGQHANTSHMYVHIQHVYCCMHSVPYTWTRKLTHDTRVSLILAKHLPVSVFHHSRYSAVRAGVRPIMCVAVEFECLVIPVSGGMEFFYQPLA